MDVVNMPGIVLQCLQRTHNLPTLTFATATPTPTATTTPPATDAAAGPGGKIGRNVFYEWARQPAGDGNDFYYNIVTRERVWERPADFPGDVLVIAGGVTTRIPRAQAEARMRSLLVRWGGEQGRRRRGKPLTR